VKEWYFSLFKPNQACTFSEKTLSWGKIGKKTFVHKNKKNLFFFFLFKTTMFHWERCRGFIREHHEERGKGDFKANL